MRLNMYSDATDWSYYMPVSLCMIIDFDITPMESRGVMQLLVHTLNLLPVDI